jgi:hypothetical protein
MPAQRGFCVSDDIPIIFAEDLRRADRAATPAAVFLSAASPTQMQQYVTAGWTVWTAPGFQSSMPINLDEVPARPLPEAGLATCTLLSCEAPFLNADVANMIARLQPAFVKINCAFHDVADAAALGKSLAGFGYHVAAAQWRDDNSFGIRAVVALGSLASLAAPEWDRINFIGIRDRQTAEALLTVARVYVGEERRILDLRVANSIRNDYIARLEDALAAHQITSTKPPPL